MQPNQPSSEMDQPMETGFSGKDIVSKLTVLAPDQNSVDKYADSLFQPIPEGAGNVEGWKNIEVKEGGEKLEPLGMFSGNDDICTAEIYAGTTIASPYAEPGSRLDGALTAMFVRQDVATKLRYAQQLLPEGHYLIVMDSLRTLKVQQALYDNYLDGVKAAHSDWDTDTLSTETQKYVSLPSVDPSRPSPHNTGGSVDVEIFRLPDAVNRRVREIDDRLDVLAATIPEDPTPEQEANDPDVQEAYILVIEKDGLIRDNIDLLDFGTPFDYGGAESALRYYEELQEKRPLTDDETEARDNRRELYNATSIAGLMPYRDEYWHFNAPQSQMGAQVAGLDVATYGAAELSEENRAHERMREMHHAGMVRLGSPLGPMEQFERKIDPLFDALIRLNMKARNKAPETTHSNMPRAAVIAPPEESAA